MGALEGLRERRRGLRDVCSMTASVAHWLNTSWMACVMIACVLPTWSDSKSWVKREYSYSLDQTHSFTISDTSALESK